MSAGAQGPAFKQEGRIEGPETVALLLSFLAQIEWSGLLQLRSGGVERRLFLNAGRLHAAESDSADESLLALLLERGQVTEADLTKARAHLGLEGDGMECAQGLVRLGMLAEADLEAGEQARLAQLVELAVACRVGEFACQEGMIPQGASPHFMELAQLIATSVMGRWPDEWAMNVLGGVGTVLRLDYAGLPAWEATGADEAYDLTLLLADGKKSIKQVLEESPLPELAAVKCLAAGVVLGCLTRVEVEEVAPPPAPKAPKPAAVSPPPSQAPAPAVEAEPAAPAAADAGVYRPSRPGRSATLIEPAPQTKSGSGKTVLLVVLLAALLATMGYAAYKGWLTLTPSSVESEAAP